jgi:hypothetical protein
MLQTHPPLFKTPFFRKLSDDQIRQIHNASLRYWNGSAYLHDEDALALLKSGRDDHGWQPGAYSRRSRRVGFRGGSRYHP